MSKVLHETAGRLEVTGAIGEKLQKQVDQAVAEENQHAGAAGAFAHAAQSVEGIGAHVAQAFKDGDFKGLSAPQVKAKIDDYLRQAATCCRNLVGLAKTKQVAAQGKSSAAQASLDLVANYHTSAKRRHDALTAPVEDDPDAKDGPTRIRGKGKPTLVERRAGGKKATKKSTKKKAKKKAAKKSTRGKK